MNLFKTETPFPAKVLSVNELTLHLKKLLENDSILSSVWVQGEVSNLVKAASGHCYFTLKDGKAVLKAALWAGNRRRIGVEFKTGDSLMVFGNISVYPPRGEYQISVTDLRQSGIGALYEAYEKLKKKLQAEGLFDMDRKLPLPFIPKGVGIVTSPSGAVVQDIFRVIRRRFINTPLYLVPAKVQGDGAAAEVADGIRRLNLDPRVEVIIIARGGGSLEDLWAFNEEVLVRAISESKKPIVSAVGHETDTTIADLVADKRAATPSVAGELVVPVKAELQQLIKRQNTRLNRAANSMLALLKERYKRAASCRFLARPSLLVAERRVTVMNLTRELETIARHYIAQARHRFELLKTKLVGLNPESALDRGYIMALDEQGRVVNSVKQLSPGKFVNLHFADGIAGAKTTGDIQEKKSCPD